MSNAQSILTQWRVGRHIQAPLQHVAEPQAGILHCSLCHVSLDGVSGGAGGSCCRSGHAPERGRGG